MNGKNGMLGRSGNFSFDCYAVLGKGCLNISLRNWGSYLYGYLEVLWKS